MNSFVRCQLLPDKNGEKTVSWSHRRKTKKNEFFRAAAFIYPIKDSFSLLWWLTLPSSAFHTFVECFHPIITHALSTRKLPFLRERHFGVLFIRKRFDARTQPLADNAIVQCNKLQRNVKRTSETMVVFLFEFNSLF